MFRATNSATRLSSSDMAGFMRCDTLYLILLESVVRMIYSSRYNGEIADREQKSKRALFTLPKMGVRNTEVSKQAKHYSKH